MKDEAKGIMDSALSANRKVLTEFESKMVLKAFEIPVTRIAAAGSCEAALEVARRIGFPVALKIDSPDILHKSDVKGVVLDVESEDGVSKAFNEILRSVKISNPDARVFGVTVQEMLSRGLEVVVGVAEDASFKHSLMFGLGGVFVEVLRDVSFSPIPVSMDDALSMVEEVKGSKLLKGFRGQPPCDVKAVQELLVKVSDLVLELEDYVAEMDLNPVFVYGVGNGCRVADARIILC